VKANEWHDGVGVEIRKQVTVTYWDTSEGAYVCAISSFLFFATRLQSDYQYAMLFLQAHLLHLLNRMPCANKPPNMIRRHQDRFKASLTPHIPANRPKNCDILTESDILYSCILDFPLSRLRLAFPDACNISRWPPKSAC
jgi:hypothetical protein